MCIRDRLQSITREFLTQNFGKSQPLGENSLRSIIKVMIHKANLPGKTQIILPENQRAHASIIQALPQPLFNNLQVTKNIYTIASIEMQKNMSDI